MPLSQVNLQHFYKTFKILLDTKLFAFKQMCSDF